MMGAHTDDVAAGVLIEGRGTPRPGARAARRGSALGGRAPAWLVAVALVAGCLPGAVAVPAYGVSRSQAVTRHASVRDRGQVAAAYGRLPLAFEPNHGQTAAQVRYLAHGPGYGVFITADRTVLALAPRASANSATHTPLARHGVGAALSFRAVGGAAGRVVAGGARLPGAVGYLTGRDPAGWRTGVPTYREVTVEQVYPGVGLRWHGSQQGLEYDVVVSAGADAGAVRLAVEGLSGRLRLRAGGDLVMPTAAGDVVQRAPRAYQLIGGARQPVAVRFDVTGSGDVGFSVGRYDHRRPLIIDPTLVYSTFLGGTASDGGLGIAVDSAGNAYVAGTTSSTDFPVTAGAFQTTYGGGGEDAFVAKLNPSGTALVYSTYLGGTGTDHADMVAVDASGNAYVAGFTDSTNFPVTAGVFQPARAGSFDAFVTKVSPTGTALVYSSYLGGTLSDNGVGIAVDSAGSAYVIGLTQSTAFPVTVGAFQIAYGGGPDDAFVTKVNPAGTALVYSTYLGGTGDDEGFGIAVDSAGDAYLSGLTDSGNFPVTAGAFQPALAGSSDAFVTKVNPAGTALAYSTYLGGTKADQAFRIAVDSAGSAYVTGVTASTDFPVTAGAFQPALAGGAQDAFVTKVGPTGTALVYSTYLGGTGDDQGVGIALDSAGNAYVTGGTSSTDFPVTADAFQPTYGGGIFDAFLAKLDASGTALSYSTYFGGTGFDQGFGIAVDSMGGVYLTGPTASTDFPITAGAAQATYGGGTSDAFIAKFLFPSPSPSPTAVAAARARRRVPARSAHVRHRQRQAAVAVARNTSDSAVSGDVNTHARTATLHTSAARHPGSPHAHPYGRPRR